MFSAVFGALIAQAIAILVAYRYAQDIPQQRHTILRNYPVVGHLRYFFG